MTLPAFYPIVSSVATAEAVLEAGAKILQYRNKQFFSRAAFEDASRIAELCRQGRRNVRDERSCRRRGSVESGAASGPGGSGPFRRPANPARAGTIVGFSTHNEKQLREGDGEPVDYLAIGPIFATGSKQNPDPVVGLEQLRALRRLTQKPLVAIGGITRELAPQVFAAGADSIAVISDLVPDPRARAAEWLAISAGVRVRDGGVPEAR